MSRRGRVNCQVRILTKVKIEKKRGLAVILAVTYTCILVAATRFYDGGINSEEDV